MFWEKPLCPLRRTSPQRGEKEEEKEDGRRGTEA